LGKFGEEDQEVAHGIAPRVMIRGRRGMCNWENSVGVRGYGCVGVDRCQSGDYYARSGGHAAVCVCGAEFDAVGGGGGVARILEA
jgi:hypothetical protein